MTKAFYAVCLLGLALSIGCGGSNTSAVPEGYESAPPAGPDKGPVGAGAGEESGGVDAPPPPAL